MRQTISAAKARDAFGEIMARARYSGDYFIVESRGKPMVAIIGIEEYQALEEVLMDLADLRDARETLAEYDPSEAVDYDSYMEQRLGG